MLYEFKNPIRTEPSRESRGPRLARLAARPSRGTRRSKATSQARWSPGEQVLEHSEHIGVDVFADLDLHLRMYARKINRLADQCPCVATTEE